MKNSSFFLLLLAFSLCIQNSFAQAEKPNILLIITDDQGYGDFGFTGNTQIQTPTLDSLAAVSAQFMDYYVSPVCAPTRASLMTGRYSLRTGIRDTYNGGAIMSTDEITIAELLKKQDYRTGIFGKWHLGDNYPSRPMDQGFDESVIHLSGGMGQVGDFTTYFEGDRSYFDPVLWKNGRQEKYMGYCSDIFTDEAIKFSESTDDPFFLYLSFNAPHTPLQVPEEYLEPYKNIDPQLLLEANNPHGLELTDKNKEDARRVYAMVSNIDENLNRLFSSLRKSGKLENTLVIFMTDNGPQQTRYVGGMRGAKGSVYRGGVRVPLLMSHPSLLKGNRQIQQTAAHLDILPTLADLLDIETPSDRKIDGMSLLPFLDSENQSNQEREFFFYWTRKYPVLYQNIAFQKGNLRLVGNKDYDADNTELSLFDYGSKPEELDDLSSKNTEIVSELKTRLDDTYKELIESENLMNPPYIHVGTGFENPSYLNRNDADGDRGIWAQEDVFGKWDVKAEKGLYNVKFKFIKPIQPGGQVIMEFGPYVYRKSVEEETDVVILENVSLPEYRGDLIPLYQNSGSRIFPFWVRLDRIDLARPMN